MKFMEYNELKDREECVLDTSELKTTLANKVDKVKGKGLSTNDLTNDLKDNIPQFISDYNIVFNRMISLSQSLIEDINNGNPYGSSVEFSLSNIPENDGNWFIIIGSDYYPVIVTSDGFKCETENVQIDIEYSSISTTAAEVTTGENDHRFTIYKLLSYENIELLMLVYRLKNPLRNEFLEPSVTIVNNLTVGGKVKQYGEPTEDNDLVTKKYLSDNMDSFIYKDHMITTTTFEVLEGYTYGTPNKYDQVYCADVKLPFKHFTTWNNAFWSFYWYMSYYGLNVKFTFSDGTTKEAPLMSYSRLYLEVSIPTFIVDYYNCTDSTINKFNIEFFGNGIGNYLESGCSLMNIPEDCTSIQITMPNILASEKYVDDSLEGYATEDYVNSKIGNLSIKSLTQDEYDALTTKEENVLYLITE